MAHTFLSLNMTLIPQTTKDNIPNFWKQLFSNDGVKDRHGEWVTEPSYVLFDAYNNDGELVHSNETFIKWVQWSEHPQQVIDDLIATATEHTKQEFDTLINDVSSLWYVELMEPDL